MSTPEFEQIGPYSQPRFIAEGGMAWVFHVQDYRFQDRKLALKLLKPDAAQGEELRLFEREAELLAGIDHPNLITIFESGRDDATGHFYYSMSYIDGPSLSELVSQRGGLSAAEAGKLLLGVLDGLDQLHQRGIVHRDIKPGNILVAPGNRPVLMDLGIARVTQESELTQYEHTDVIRGTPLYMSPEQSEGQHARASSDIFSVGLSLYFMLTGRTVYDEARDVDSANPQSVRSYLGHLNYANREFDVGLPKEVSRALRGVIRKACRLKPEERYQDAGAMRTALAAALESDVGGGREIPRPLIFGGAGALGLSAVAAAAYFLWWVPEGVGTVREQAEALDGSVAALLERAKDLEPAPPRNLLGAADDLVDRAQNYLVDAIDDHDQGDSQLARKSFERAIAQYGAACGKLVDPLAGRAKRAAGRADRQIADLRDVGAPDLVPQLWAGVASVEIALAAPGEGAAPCDALTSHLDRLVGADQVRVASLAIEAALPDVLKQIVDKERETALKERSLAQVEAAAAGEYRTAMSDGRSSLERGDASRDAEDFRAARDAYRKSAEHFRMASQVGPAARSREAARRVASELARSGTSVPAEANVLIAEADAAYTKGAYAQAVGSYQTATTAMRKLLGDAVLRREALKARTVADVTREGAMAQGAQNSASKLLARGDAQRQEAVAALEAGRYDEAERTFKEAEKDFARAQSGAIEALAAARNFEIETRRQLDELLGDRDCAALRSSTAREECKTVQTGIEQGGEYVATKDAPGARRAFQDARDALERASVAEDLLAPPEVVARTPHRDTIEVFRNRPVALAVEAQSRNAGDQLQYTWTFAGRPLPAGEGRLDWTPEGSGEAVVTVSNGRAETVERWKVVVKNRKPELKLTPGTKTLSLAPGKTQSFEAATQDPDGDRVETIFKLDGQQVASGASFLFTADTPGDFRLEVVATDAGGAKTTQSRRIRVKKPVTVASVPPPSTRSTPKPTPRSAPTQPAAAANRAPVLDVTPAAALVALRAGETKEFQATTRDPEGDAVTTIFRLDGTQVASGPSYRFSAGDPGEHLLEVVARDSGGRETKLTRRIRVEARAAPAAPLEGWRAALDRYEKALEQKDMRRLEAVWLLPAQSLYRTRWASKFRRPDPLEISISVRKVVREGDRVIVIFEQEESQGQRKRSYTYKAVLLKRATTDDWQIIDNQLFKT